MTQASILMAHCILWNTLPGPHKTRPRAAGGPWAAGWRPLPYMVFTEPVISKAEYYKPRFPIPSGAPCALSSLFTSVQYCLEILVLYLVICRINQFSNLRLTIDDFTAYPQVNVFTTTCGSLSESKLKPHHTTRHIILSLGHKLRC